MSTALARGANIALTQANPDLRRVLVGLGWAPSSGRDPFDLDASALLVGPDGKVPNDAHFVFYNQLAAPDVSVTHSGDHATGSGDGDDEEVEVDLTRVPDYVDRIVFAVSIYQAQSRRQTFEQVKGAYIRVLDLDRATELARYDLSHDCAGETALVFGELYRHRGGWKFRAVGQGWAEGLEGIARDYGVDLGR